MGQRGARRQIQVAKVVYGQAKVEQLLTELLAVIATIPNPVETTEDVHTLCQHQPENENRG